MGISQFHCASETDLEHIQTPNQNMPFAVAHYTVC